MGLFSCCMSDRKQTKHEAEARHARIIDIYRQAEVEAHSVVVVPPPAYDEAVFNNAVGNSAFMNEKLLQAQIQPLSQLPQPIAHVQPRESISRPGSPQTSIYSVPSTRMTDITSAYTGGTITVVRTQTGDSPRSSLAFDSAPPSYYDGRSMRERSRSPHEHRQPEEQQEHPVVAGDWLEVLRRAAAEEENTTRRRGGLM